MRSFWFAIWWQILVCPFGILSHFITVCHLLKQFVRFCQSLSHVITFCHILLDVVIFCHFLSEFVTFWTCNFGFVWYLYEGYFAVAWCKYSNGGNKNRMTRNCKRGHGKQQPGVSFDFLFCCSFLTKKLVGVPFVCISWLASFVFHFRFVLLVKCFDL